MIKRLSIQNYAIIDEVTIQFSDHLTIITGETGAGKSILMGALGLIMGDRTETRVLYDASKKCIVEGHFDILYYPLKPLFDELDIEYDTDLIIRREISASGRSRAFINDTPIRLEDLRIITARLIDLHRQFDTLDIQNEDFQLEMIDALADNKPLLDSYITQFRAYQTNKRTLQALEEAQRRAVSEFDFFTFQLDELVKSAFVNGEQEQLETELTRLTNAEDIKRNLTGAFMGLSESDTAAVSQLRDIASAVYQVRNFHPLLPDIYSRFQSAIVELQEIASELNDIAEDTEYDEARIAYTQERLDLLYRLQKKHNVNDIGSLLIIQDQLQAKVDAVGDRSEEIAALRSQIATQEANLLQLASQLTARRMAQFAPFEQSVKTMLRELAMPFAQISVTHNALPELSSKGLDSVSFLFNANKGVRLQPIRNAASGGELSRLTLCAKSLVANAIPLPTMIFDEIDSGVSGDVAGKMGNILRKLSSDHQVVVITHTAQIAAKANAHYFVYKQHETDRTRTRVKVLSREERITEIATMLSGSPPSQYAIRNAIDLMAK